MCDVSTYVHVHVINVLPHLDDICGDVEKVFGNYTSPLPTSKPASEPVNGDIELMIGLIVGGVLLLLCLCCLTICLCCVCYKKKKRTETRGKF